MNTLVELETEEETLGLSDHPLESKSDSAARKLVNGALSKPAPPQRTAAGTPYAASWSKSWIARVTQTETRLQRRICGARLPDGSPCELESHHDSGRCRMHGGFDLTGAPAGNSNAEIHGLYARRLKTCGPQCPMWNECPCAGADVAAMEPAKRPTCPYEQVEYDSAVAEALKSAKRSGSATPVQDAHTLALLQVMTTRASLAVRNEPLAFEVGFVSEGKFCQTGSKLTAHFQAFTRIVAEYRRFAATLKPKKKTRATLTANEMTLLAALIPEAPEPAQVPLAASESHVASVSEVFEVPSVPLVPRAPSSPDNPTAPSVSSAHSVPLVSEVHNVHQVHSVHKIPEPVISNPNTNHQTLLNHVPPRPPS